MAAADGEGLQLGTLDSAVGATEGKTRRYPSQDK
tara:strand:- start:1535 stop:1636 length:102 start_codon:yes stop_codon:yes gene_type:complete